MWKLFECPSCFYKNVIFEGSMTVLRVCYVAFLVLHVQCARLALRASVEACDLPSLVGSAHVTGEKVI